MLFKNTHFFFLKFSKGIFPHPNQTAIIINMIEPSQTSSLATRSSEMLSCNSKPSDYLLCSLLNIICFCALLGLPALIYSLKTRQANKYDDIEQAKKFSKKAKNFNLFATFFGFFIFFSLIYTMSWFIISTIKS